MKQMKDIAKMCLVITKRMKILKEMTSMKNPEESRILIVQNTLLGRYKPATSGSNYLENENNKQQNTTMTNRKMKTR